jgi:hypothetical protein
MAIARYVSRAIPVSLVLGLAALVAPPASTGIAQVPSNPALSTPRAAPFGVGERLEYDVKFGPLRVGSGSLTVEAIDTLRNREVWHASFRVKGGTFLYKVDDISESWFDTQTLSSLRYKQDYNEGGRTRKVTFEIFPERAVYRVGDDPEEESVRNPMDETSFLYFVRTIPLEVGKTYDYNRYFRPDRNPVRLRVLRKERIRVPAGTFDAIVVQPIIKTPGIFSQNGNAQVWLSDDANRMMLQMKSNLSFGSINLYLKSFRLGKP